jgi:predicted DCC family thiol-disulfide oxidoreductase YuxK
MDSKVDEAQAAVSAARAVLIYDGSCGLCRGGVSWISRRAVRGHFEFLPCQAAERRARYPWMSDRACLEAMQLILPDGRILAGDAAIPEILRRLRGWRWLAGVFRLPGVEALAPLLYAWVARHRYQISCMLGRRRAADPRPGRPTH